MSLELLFLLLCLIAAWFVAFDALWLIVLNLRGSARAWDKEKDGFKTDAQALSDGLGEALHALGDGEHAEPYKLLYDQGKTLARNRIDGIEYSINAAGETQAADIPETPLKRSLLLIPLYDEIRARRDWHARSLQIAGSAAGARAARDEMARIRQKIAGLGKEYKNRTQQKRDKAQELSNKIQATPQPALDDMLAESKKIVERLAQAAGLFAADDPAEPDVCRAYPDILQGEKQLGDLETRFERHLRQHEQTQAKLDEISKRLDPVDKEIAAEKDAGFPVEWLVSERAKWAKEIEEIQDALSRGKEDLDDRVESLGQRIETGNQSLKERREWREKVTAQHGDMTSRLKSAIQWTQTKDPRFEFDLTQPSIDKAENTLQEMQYTTLREDRQRQDVTPLTQTINEHIKTIGTNQKNHEKLLEDERTLRGQLGTVLPKTVENADALAVKLEGCHANYRTVQPSELKDTRRQLWDDWEQSGSPDALIKESEFGQVVEKLRRIQVKHAKLQTLCATAGENVKARDRDKTEADRVLSQVSSPDQTLPALTDWKEAQDLQGYIKSSVAKLGAQMKEPAPNYADILRQGNALLQEVNSRRSELKRRLDESRASLTGTREEITAIQSELDRFQMQSTLSWEKNLAPLRENINGWLAEFASVQGISIERMDRHRETGRGLLTRLDESYKQIQQKDKDFAGELSSAEKAVAEAEQSLDKLELLLKRGGKYNSTGWVSIPRAAAESEIAESGDRLVELQQARLRHTAQDAGQIAREIKGLAESGKRTVDREERDLKQTMDTLENSSSKLAGLVRDCRRVAASSKDEDVQNRWSEIEREIEQAQESCRSAVSAKEAMDLLNEAIASARRFSRQSAVP